MSKKQIMIGLIMASLSIVASATNPIPDPTVQIMTPPAGLPGVKNEMSIPNPVFNELNLQGISIGKDKNTPNKVFMNGGFYKVGDVVSDLWKVTGITRKKVTLINVETKQTKILNISGE